MPKVITENEIEEIALEYLVRIGYTVKDAAVQTVIEQAKLLAEDLLEN